MHVLRHGAPGPGGGGQGVSLQPRRAGPRFHKGKRKTNKTKLQLGKIKLSELLVRDELSEEEEVEEEVQGSQDSDDNFLNL